MSDEGISEAHQRERNLAINVIESATGIIDALKGVPFKDEVRTDLLQAITVFKVDVRRFTEAISK